MENWKITVQPAKSLGNHVELRSVRPVFKPRGFPDVFGAPFSALFRWATGPPGPGLHYAGVALALNVIVKERLWRQPPVVGQAAVPFATRVAHRAVANGEDFWGVSIAMGDPQ